MSCATMATRRIGIAEARRGLAVPSTAAGARIATTNSFNRDKASLDIFWLKDESVSDSNNLRAPDVIAAEILENWKAALEQFREIPGDMESQNDEVG